MMIKVIPFTAVDPQRPHDLKSLLRYLIVGRGGSGGLDAFTRLFGPPFARHIIQRVWPFGVDFRIAAHDTSHQIFSRVRMGCSEVSLPRQVYAHVILSFAPRRRRRVVDDSAQVAAFESPYSGALRIVLDALKRLGVNDQFPLFVVLHGDRRHLHAHAVVGLFAMGIPRCGICELNRSSVWKIAKQVDLDFGLGRVTAKQVDRHGQIVTSYAGIESKDQCANNSDLTDVMSISVD